MFRPFKSVAFAGLALAACLPVSAEVLVREDFSGYVGAALTDMPVAPGTGLEGAFLVTLGSQGLKVAADDVAHYRWGPGGAQELTSAFVRAANAYQRPRLQAKISQLSGGGAITGRTVWVRFLVHFPFRNPGPKASEPNAKPSDPGVVWLFADRPPFAVGVRNERAGSGATLFVGESWSKEFDLPADPARPVCVVGRLKWDEGIYRSMEVWLNPRVENGGFIAEIAAPPVDIAALKLSKIEDVRFQWSPLSTSKSVPLPGLGAIAFGETLADLMPGLPEPPSMAAAP